MNNLEYNTERSALIIPEYGRHVQKMIQKAISIEDRTQRNNTAQSIIAVMGNLFPHLRDVPDFQHKLWDQLFIMSEFKLDVDSPFEKPTPEIVTKRPDRLNYPQSHPKYRFYGNNIKKMIDVCVSWEDSELKEKLKFSIANHMKKSYLAWNKETVDDEVVFVHLYELSDGKIDLAKTKNDLAQTKEFVKPRQNFSHKSHTNYKFKKTNQNYRKN